jgi:hypothetical protein
MQTTQLPVSQNFQLVTNLFQGELYYLEDGDVVKYEGFIPADGHYVRFVPDSKHEFVLPHGTKFYRVR